MRKDKTPLKARIEDLVNACEQYGFAVGNFLTEEEQAEGAVYLKSLQKTSSFLFAFCGGAEGAERKTVVLYDRSYEDATPLDFADITLIKLTATDKTVPSHRAVLGSILGLGIERKMIGDIFPFEDGTAVAVKEQILPYIQKELYKVGQSKVILSPVALPNGFKIERQTEELSLSVASLRLDCMIAAICKLSREDATEIISSGKIQVDHKEVTRADFKLSEHSTISVKGKGRFVFEKQDGNTKSGRLRVRVLRYI